MTTRYRSAPSPMRAKYRILERRDNAYIMHKPQSTCKPNPPTVSVASATIKSAFIPNSPVLTAPLRTVTSTDNSSHPYLQLDAKAKPSEPHYPTTQPKALPSQDTTVTQTLLNMVPHHLPTDPNDAQNLALAWHLTLNHEQLERLRQMANDGVLPSLHPSCLANTRPFTCSACRHAHRRTAPHHRAQHYTVSPGHSTSTDTISPISQPSTDKYRHVFTFVDIRT